MESSARTALAVGIYVLASALITVGISGFALTLGPEHGAAVMILVAVVLSVVAGVFLAVLDRALRRALMAEGPVAIGGKLVTVGAAPATVRGRRSDGDAAVDRSAGASKPLTFGRWLYLGGGALIVVMVALAAWASSVLRLRRG